MNSTEAIKLILVHEGGYVNNPADPGGETNFGIAKKFYPNIDIKKLTIEQAAQIYYQDYWKRCRCDELNIGVALYVFDTAVNQGVNFAIRMLQAAGGAKVDGKIGPQTINASNNNSASALLDTMSQLRVARYKKTHKFDVFGRGWLAREAKTLKEAKKIC